jgi:hypothetical protein
LEFIAENKDVIESILIVPVPATAASRLPVRIVVRIELIGMIIQFFLRVFLIVLLFSHNSCLVYVSIPMQRLALANHIEN